MTKTCNINTHKYRFKLEEQYIAGLIVSKDYIAYKVLTYTGKGEFEDLEGRLFSLHDFDLYASCDGIQLIPAAEWARGVEQ